MQHAEQIELALLPAVLELSKAIRLNHAQAALMRRAAHHLALFVKEAAVAPLSQQFLTK